MMRINYMWAMNWSVKLGLGGGLAVLVLIVLGYESMLPWAFAFMLACLMLAIWFRNGVYKTVFRYKGASIRYIQEAPMVWSSHICGHELRLIWNAMCRSVDRTLVQWGWRRCTRVKDKSIRLLDAKEDRQRVNELSLQAFELMLDQLEHCPGAVIISASALNFSDRQPRRLQDRIDAVQKRPAWQYARVVRQLRRAETWFGRWVLDWPVRPGQDKHEIVPGIVVWRGEDGAPCMKKMALVPCRIGMEEK